MAGRFWHYPGRRNDKLVFYSPPVVTPDGLVIVGSAGNEHSLVALNPNDINPDTKCIPLKMEIYWCQRSLGGTSARRG